MGSKLIYAKLTTSRTQPPKRRGAATSSSATGPKRARPSKLAKENDITAEEENEIKEVFQLFADAHEDFPAEKEGVIPREDVRKAMVYVAPLLSQLPTAFSAVRDHKCLRTLSKSLTKIPL